MACRRTAIALGTAVLACACGSAHRSTARVAVRDSAGIQIVENVAGADPAVVTADVDLTIGIADGDPAYIFGQIVDVAVQHDGTIVVLDQQAQELRFYDANGRFVRSAGGPGEGPGELSDQLLAVSVSPSDSIYVADYDMGRIDVYDPGGEPARTIRTPAHHLLNMVVSAEGDALGRVWHSSVDRRSGAFRIFDAIVAVGTAHGALDTVLEFDHTPPDFGTALENRWPVIANTAFWDRLVDGDIVWSSLEWNRVRVSTTGGRLARLVSFSVWHFRPVTEEEYAPLVAYSRQSDPRSPDPDAQLAPNAVMPTQLPAITAVRAAPDGGFWVQRMGPVTDAERPYPVINTAWLGGRLWDVFDTNGRYVRTVRVPDRFCLTRVTPSGAIGIQRGDMDVERVMRLVVGTP